MELPANSVIWAFCGGLIATVAMHYAAAYGYQTPPDIAAGLPAAIAVLLAHLVPDKK